MIKQKPKSYGFYFMKHGLIFLGVWIVILYVGIRILNANVANILEQDVKESYYNFKEDLMQSVKADSVEKRQAALMLVMPNCLYPEQPVSYAGISSVAYIVDTQTQETVGLTDCNAKEYTLMVIFDKDKDYANQGVSGDWTNMYETVFYCKNEELKQYLGDLENRLEAWKERIGEAENNSIKQEFLVLIESYYYWDAYFLPGRITVKYEERNGLGNLRREEILETITCEPEHPENYEYVEVDSEKQHVYSNISQLYSDNGDVLNRWNALRDRAKKYVDQIDEETRNDYYDPYRESISDETYYTMPKTRFYARKFFFRDATGKIYKAVFYCEADTEELMFHSIFLNDVLTLYGISFIILFVIAFLTSEWEYRKKRYVFMTEGYRDMLVDSMAHDLKSPLMAISGYAENLKDNLKENQLEKSEYYAEKIYDNAGYVNSLITKNLEALRYDHQAKKLVKQRLDLRKLFEEAVQRHQNELEERNLHVTMEGESQAKGDEEMLQRVADNLIANCIRYGSEEGEIKIAFGTNKLVLQNQTELTYQGNLKKLWEPFVRGEESRSGKGTGLGLAITANVLDRHGWKYSLGYDKEKKLFTCTIRFRP